jgi:hypothetical protein
MRWRCKRREEKRREEKKRKGFLAEDGEVVFGSQATFVGATHNTAQLGKVQAWKLCFRVSASLSHRVA